MEKTWPDKLEELKKQHNSSYEQLADMLGISTRTLADLMKPKPVAEDGRLSEPTKPIQRLVNHLLSSELSRPGLNLVLIHSDFKVSKDAFDDNDVINSVIKPLLALNAEAPRITTIVDTRQPEAFRNEYHYITIPNDKVNTTLLLKNNILPNYLLAEDEVETEKTLDVFFAVTAMRLVSKTISQNLAHVTIAANIETFWSLGQQIQEIGKEVGKNIGVTFVRQFGVIESENLRKTILKDNCQIIDPPLGRRSGIVSSIHPGGFGFIKDLFEPNKSGIFFSWNHMKLDENGIPEVDIQQLKVGDKVSYTIGVNNKGPCAANVAIVERHDQTRLESVSPTLKKQILTTEEQDFLKNKLTDAISICADADGWALLADVGSRIKLMFPQATESLNAKGYKLSLFVKEELTEIFEYSSDGKNTHRTAACIRLKKSDADEK